MKKCSLNGAKYILVDERIYCANKNELMNQTRAMNYCKELNATLPLPVSLLEFEVFSNFSSPDKAWIGISDTSNSGKEENWVDVENKQPAFVKKMVLAGIFTGHTFLYKAVCPRGNRIWANFRIYP